MERVGVWASEEVGASVGDASTSGTGQSDHAVYEYVGTKTCRKCHSKTHRSFEKSKKADAWELLKPGSHSAEKAAVGLDASVDYTTDARCLTCHSVGFGHAGGYETPTPGDDRAEREAEVRQGVGCEACHGPGSAFIKVMKNIRREKREYTLDELFAVGLKRMDQQSCTACHNADALCVVGPDGSGLEKAKVEFSDRDGFHSQVKLKYRKE